jgi:predicted porin
MRKIALFSTTLLAGFVSIAPAHAVDVKLYGQVNKALMGYDDGANTDFAVVDNDLSSTRFGVKGEQKLDNGLTATVLLEMESQSNASDVITQSTTANQSTAPANDSTTNLVERHAAVGLTGQYGGVVLGKTSTATDGVFLKDKAGVADIMSADIFKFGGSLFYTNESNGVSSTVSTKGRTFQGATDRSQVVRFDTAKVNGFSGKASISQGGDVDASAQYENKFGGFDVIATGGVKLNNDSVTNSANATETRYIASASAKHESGFAGTVAYATEELANKTATAQEPDQWYAKLSYAWDAYEVAADYGVANNFGALTTAKSEITSYGVGGQYNLGNGVSLAGMYRNFDADVTGSNLSDIDMFVANMRVKF